MIRLVHNISLNLNPILPGVLVHPHFTWGQKSLNPLIPEIVLLRAYSRKITWPAVAIQIISPAWILMFYCLILSACLSTKLRLPDCKSCQTLMCLTFHTRAVLFFPMLKEKNIYMKFLFTFTKKKKSQVPKIGIPLSK